jgi:SNF2 family DNA or RNA helicase
MVQDTPGVGLFWRPGTGKTVTALTAIGDLLITGDHGDKVLIVAPLRVARDTWVREAARWSHLGHLKVQQVLGGQKERLRALAAPADVYVINVENFVWLAEHYGDAWPFKVVVIDEYSGFKAWGSARVKALKKIRGSIGRLVGLTGSPAAQGYESLFTLVGLLDGGKRLGRTLTQFRDLWMEPDARSRTQVYSWKLRTGKKEEIDAAIADICYSVPAGELPECTFNDVVVTLGASELALYEEMKAESIVTLGGDAVIAANAAVLVGKLQQIASGGLYAEDGSVIEIHAAKMDALERIVEEAGGPVLVYYGFVHELDRLKSVFKDVNPLKTAADIARWNKGGSRVAAMHPGSAYGLNLQDGGATIVWLTLPWSLEQYEQANARLHRQGQREPVIIHRLLVEDSVDLDVVDALERKDLGQSAMLAALGRVIAG